MTFKVYVVHVTNLNQDGKTCIGGIFTKIKLATDRQEFLVRKAKELDRFQVETWIETVVLND